MIVSFKGKMRRLCAGRFQIGAHARDAGETLRRDTRTADEKFMFHPWLRTRMNEELSMKLEDVGEVIATRTLMLPQDEGRATEIFVLLGKPQQLPDHPDYYCPYQIKGAGSEKIKPLCLRTCSSTIRPTMSPISNSSTRLSRLSLATRKPVRICISGRSLRGEAGCLNYDPHQSLENAEIWFVYENGRSVQGSGLAHEVRSGLR
jgi:hypothetical protein